MGYTMQVDPETSAKALGRDLPISPKKSVEVCNMVRGLDVNGAIKILEEVIQEKRAVPYKKHKKKVSHQKGIGPGGYPKKVAKYIRDLIEEAKTNAEDKALDSDNMRIVCIAAHEGEEIQRNRPRAFGRSSPFNRKTTNVEVILQEKEA